MLKKLKPNKVKNLNFCRFIVIKKNIFYLVQFVDVGDNLRYNATLVKTFNKAIIFT